MSKKLSFKRRLFADNYCNPASDTFHHGQNSAIKAGYAPKNAVKQASALLKCDDISRYIAHREEQIVKKCEISRKEASALAWKHYEEAENNRDKRYWWEEFNKLKGHYVQRIEQDSKVTFNKDKQEENYRLAKELLDKDR